MDSDNIRWFNIDKINLNENFSFSDERLISCQLSKIYHYSEARNAYWNTTSNLWPGDHAFHFDIQVIKDRIEKDRKRGSYFSIFEIPCIVLKGKEDSIVLIDKYPRSSIPFCDFKNIENIESTESNIKKIFDCLSSKSLMYGFIMESLNVTPFETPLYRFNSISSGHQYTLNYYRRTWKCDVQYLLKGFELFHNYLSPND